MSDRPVPAASDPSDGDLTRRDLFAALAATGIGSAVFQRAVAAQGEKSVRITAERIREAEWVAGLELSIDDRIAVARLVGRWQRGLQKVRRVKLANSVPFPLVFSPAPGSAPGERAGTVEVSDRTVPSKPSSEEDLAFLPLAALAGLVRTRKVSSVELTKLYLTRLKKYDPVL